MEAARKRNRESTWTSPSWIMSSGAFTLRDHRRNERIVLVRNPRYYDAPLVALEELAFLPVVDGTAVMNLYKAGVAAVTPGLGLSPLFTPVLSRRERLYFAVGIRHRLSVHQHTQSSL